MAYFPNGVSGEAYEDHYCSNCIFQQTAKGPCPIWEAHLLYNYQECNKPESILHMLIPRSKDGLSNEQCRFFTRAGADRDLFDEGCDG